MKYLENNATYMNEKDKTKEELVKDVEELLGKLETLKNSEKEVKRIENALRESEEKYRTILHNIVDGYYEVDLLGNFTLFNDSLPQMFHVKSEDLIGVNYLIYTEPEIAKRVFETFNEVYQTGKPAKVFNWEIIQLDYDRRMVEASVNLIHDDQGTPTGFRGIVRDITEQNRAIEALRVSEEKYRTILDTIEDGYYEVDMNGKFTSFNDSLCHIIGYSREQLMKLDYTEFTDKETSKKVFKTFNKVFRTGRATKTYNWEIIRQNGMRRIVESSISLIEDLDGKTAGYRGIVRDSTERELTREVLRMSEEKYRTILENIEDGYYEVDLSGNMTFCNNAMCKITGFNEGELIVMNYNDIVIPEITEKLYETFNQVYKSGMPVKSIEWEMKHKNGEIKFAESSVSLILDRNKEPIGFRGIVRDVTDRKIMEERLKQTLEEVRSLSLTDELTGLYNRRGFLTIARQQLKVAHRMKGDILLLFADMDDLKEINDTYGHQEGDKALVSVAKNLNKTFRESDIIARMGGDEFAVLTLETTHSDSRSIMKRLQKNLDSTMKKNKLKYNLAVSVGIVRNSRTRTLSIEEMLDKADKKMYKEKQKKRE